MSMKAGFFAALAPLLAAGAAFAQGPATPGGGPMHMMELPAPCLGTMPGAKADMPGFSSASTDLPGHRGRMMRGMMETQGPMMQGMMNESADMAFACGMIAHHQAAIRMSEAQLEFGADATMRDMANRVISAQKAEIEELTRWVETQGGAAAGASSAAPGTDNVPTVTEAPSDPSAPAAGAGAGKSTATGAVPMDPAADTAPGTTNLSDPSAPAEGLGAGKSTATGAVPMEPAGGSAAPPDSATSADGATPPASN